MVNDVSSGLLASQPSNQGPQSSAIEGDGTERSFRQCRGFTQTFNQIYLARCR